MIRNSRLKRKSRLSPVSKKRMGENAQYSKLKTQFLEENLVCQCGSCRHPSSQVHHKARRGRFLLRTDTWMAVCASCHDYIERHGDWARSKGYILTPEQRRKA